MNLIIDSYEYLNVVLAKKTLQTFLEGNDYLTDFAGRSHDVIEALHLRYTNVSL